MSQSVTAQQRRQLHYIIVNVQSKSVKTSWGMMGLSPDKNCRIHLATKPIQISGVWHYFTLCRLPYTKRRLVCKTGDRLNLPHRVILRLMIHHNSLIQFTIRWIFCDGKYFRVLIQIQQSQHGGWKRWLFQHNIFEQIHNFLILIPVYLNRYLRLFNEPIPDQNSRLLIWGSLFWGSLIRIFLRSG